MTPSFRVSESGSAELHGFDVLKLSGDVEKLASMPAFAPEGTGIDLQGYLPTLSIPPKDDLLVVQLCLHLVAAPRT